MTDFALCRTCPEVTTGIDRTDKGWMLDASSNHFGCDVKPFGKLADLPTPIRNGVMRLGAGVPISQTDIVMFKLGLDLEDQWTPFPSTVPAAASASTPSPAPALALVASTRSEPASTPTSGTPASREPDLFDLLDTT